MFMAGEVVERGYKYFASDEEPLYDFRHNPIHDYESIWRVGLWILTSNSSAGFFRNREHEEFHQEVFLGSPRARNSVFLEKTFRLELIKTLPKEFHSPVASLEKLRLSLLKAYHLSERDREMFDSAPFQDEQLPKTFETHLSAILGGLSDIVFDGFNEKGLPAKLTVDPTRIIPA